MRIIECGEGTPVVKSFERALPVFGIEKNMPLILVNADIEFLESSKRMEEIIDEIEADKERPIIFYSFDQQEKLEMRGHLASRLFYRSDVGFIKMPAELAELKKLYDFLVSGRKIANSAAEAFFYLGVKRNVLGTLLHDFWSVNLRPKVLEKAKAEFGVEWKEEDGEDEFRKKIKTIKSSPITRVKERKGKTFPGVFCDVEGTLFVEKKLKKEVLEKLKNFAEVKPVTLWTGGDLEEIKKKLVANGVKYPLVSKYAFEGCEVEIVIDDFAKEEFEKRYKIYSHEYVQV